MKEKRILFFIFLFLISLSYISALRISPAKFNFNFIPGSEHKMEFTVNSYEDYELEIFIEGDLKNYLTINETNLPKEGGTFSATLKLPDKFEIPGRKISFIGVRQVVDEELVSGGAVVVAVAIKTGIYVDVPYPGKYLETSLSSHDVNLNEPITFNLDISSKGDNQVSFKPLVNIYSESGELIDVLEFDDRIMNKGENLELKKIWDSTGYSRGSYYALSKIDYVDRIAESRSDFRIGDLVINIVNHTDEIVRNGIRPFAVEIESGWNNKIEGAYAEVKLHNETKLNLLNFKTSPINLEPWQSKTLVGYFDTNELMLGDYVAQIDVYYYGNNVEKTTSRNVPLKILEKKEINYLLILVIVMGVIILLLVIFLIFKNKLFKHGKKRK